MEIAFSCKHIARGWWWYRNKSNVIRKCGEGEINGKSKRKTLSFLSIVTVVFVAAFAAHPQNIPNYKREVSIIFMSDKALWRLLLVEFVRKSRRILHAAMRDRSSIESLSIVGLFTQHRTFTFSQQLVLQLFSSRLRNADHEPTTMMKFLIGEHRSHRVPAAWKPLQIRLAAFNACFPFTTTTTTHTFRCLISR